MPLSSLAKTREDYGVEVVYFSLPDDVEHFIDRLEELRDSAVFTRIWARHGDRFKESRRRDATCASSSLSIAAFVSYVIAPAFDEWETLCCSIDDGSIILEVLDTAFRGVLGDEQHLRKELERMLSAEELLSIRLDQILQYTSLSKTVDAARAVENVCRVLGVQHCFLSVRKILLQV